MSILNIVTNVQIDGSKTLQLLQDATKAVSRVLGKPENTVMVLLHEGVPVMCGGGKEPAAYAELVSTAGLGFETKKKVTKALTSLIESRLSVPSARFYVKLCDVQGGNLGWNGSTL